MKTKTILAHALWVCGFAMALCTAAPAFAQEQNKCSECMCSSSLFTNGCSIRCCLPKVPNCNCEWFSNACSCTTEGNSLPTIQSENLRAFSTYLRTENFSSATASAMASDLLEALAAHASGEPEAFYAIASRIEANGSKLPSNEKQLSNQWIRSHGSQNLIP